MNKLPAVLYSTEIKPEWLDYSNHMNVAFYLLVFDRAFEVDSQIILFDSNKEAEL